MYISFFVAIVVFAIAGLLIWSLAVFSKDTDRKRFAASLQAFSIAVLFIVLIWLLAWLLVPLNYGDPTGPGEAGDMFGIVTSLFSGLAFAGLISTLLMQRQELALQRDELRATRSEFSQQRFENTLFSILDLFVDHVNNMGIGNGDSPLQGRSILEYYASELKDDESTLRFDDLDDPDAEPVEVPFSEFDTLEDQIRAYVQLYDIQFEAELGPYFRLLYNAMRHIEKSNLPLEEKHKYSKIVRAHLSSSEIRLLFFNCLSEAGSGFKGWVEKYSLLKHISESHKELNPKLVASYSPLAFGLD